jgi:hypothetical protein
MSKKATLAVPLLLAWASGLYADDVIRCKGALVRSGMVTQEVLDRCGEPKAKEIESVPIRARRANGSSGVVGATQIERWTYDRGAGQFPALLTFESGKLKNIELLTGR